MMLTSSDRRFIAIVQSDGNFVVYSPWASTWNTGTYGNANPYLGMQGDGNLVLYNGANVAVWNSGTRIWS